MERQQRCGRVHAEEWCGECYEVKRGRRAYRTHAPLGELPEPAKRVIVAPETTMTREAQPTPIKPCGVALADIYAYPRLCWHLCSRKTARGTWRTPSTLTLFSEHGRWKWCLNDRHERQVAFVTVSDALAGLAELEAGLASGSLDWRRARKF